MFTILGSDGKEYGPVSADQLRAWIIAGRANLDTMAKFAGSEEWRRLGDCPEFATPSLPPPIPAPESQKSAATARTPLIGTAAEIAQTLSARSAPLDVFECLNRSFALWKANFFPLVGVTLLILLAQTILSAIPLLGMVAGFCLNGVFYGGLYYYYLGKIRGEPREAGDAFAGFTKAFVPLMLATMLVSLLTLAVAAACFGAWLAPLLKAGFPLAANVAPPIPSGPMLFGFLAGFLGMIYLSVSWMFAFPLVIDRGLGPWTAMEVSRRVVARQWFRVLFVLILGSILALLGLVAFLIGFIFTLPLLLGAMLYAYEDLCNAPEK